MKKIFSALLIFALLFSLSACTEPPLEEPPSTVLETESQTLHFMLNELPSLAPRQKDVLWEYLPGVTPDKFDPSLVYGTLIPYIGEAKLYHIYYEGRKEDINRNLDSSDGPKYGFMTTDGKIICDPIFEDFYEIEDNKGKIFYCAKDSSMPDRDDYDSVINNLYLIAKDGSVVVDLGDNASVNDIYNDKILVGAFDMSGFSLFDMKGKQIMKFDAEDECVCGFDSGVIAVGPENNYYLDSEERYVKFYNFDGKQILTDVVAADGFHDGLASAKIGDKWGVIKTDGSWLIGASSEKEINTYSDTLAVYKDGKVIIYDQSGKELVEVSQSKFEDNNYYYDFYGGVFGYSVYDKNKDLYYLADDTPIICKKNKLQASEYSESDNGKGLFVARDKAGTAYIFDIDGKLINTVKLPFTGTANVSFSYDEYIYTVSFSRVSDNEKTSYIYSAANNKLLKTLKGKEFDSETDAYNNYYSEAVSEQYFILYHSVGYNGDENHEESLCRVSDGSDVFTGAADMLITKLNGKCFYSVSYKNYIAVYDNDLKLIVKKLNANNY